MVDGVGVYPGQEQDLLIPDLKEQYKALAELLSEIPLRIPVIICPGNHDAVRLAEPQPGFDREMAQPLFNIPNAILVSNPAIVNIDASPGFPGLDILLYHGYSFDYYAANIDSIRLAGGYDRSDLIMKYLLMRRHLAPTYSSTVYLPDQEDWLVIKKAPDIFVSGHIHKSSVSSYRNTTLISGSCWQSKTAFQERVGHHPEPSRVPIVDLKTRNVKIIKFG